MIITGNEEQESLVFSWYPDHENHLTLKSRNKFLDLIT